MSYDLQNIDCNCNDCKFLIRDFDKYKESSKFHKSIQLNEFNRKKEREEIRANAQFQFDKSGLLQYGYCSKLLKSISFIPNTCQIETQSCFQHRKDN